MVQDLCRRLSDAVSVNDIAAAHVAHRALGELLALPTGGDEAEVGDLGSRKQR